jgi:HSP20 family protein
MEGSMKLRSLIPIGRDRTLAGRELYPFTSLQREVDRLFDDFTRGFGTWPTLAGGPTTDLMPSMDVTETDKEIEITAELPGLDEKDVHINLADHVLTIKGEKKEEKEEKDKDYRMVERSYGSFSRTLQLPDDINPEAVQASMTKGVLKVTVPKVAPPEAKKIEVKSAA